MVKKNKDQQIDKNLDNKHDIDLDEDFFEDDEEELGDHKVHPEYEEFHDEFHHEEHSKHNLDEERDIFAPDEELGTESSKSKLWEFITSNWAVVGVAGVIILVGGYQFGKYVWSFRTPAAKVAAERKGLFSEAQPKLGATNSENKTMQQGLPMPALPPLPQAPEQPSSNPPAAPQGPAVPAGPQGPQAPSMELGQKTAATSMLGDLHKEVQQKQDEMTVANKQLTEKLDELTAKLEQLTSQVKILDNDRDKINKLDLEVSNIKEYSAKVSSEDVTASLKGIYQYVGELAKTVNRLAVQVNRQQIAISSIVRDTVGEPVSKTSERRGLKVEAIIPGRAWLIYKDGQRQTVAVGDVIPGYGKVVEINADKSQVVTDLGKVLRQ